MAGWGVIAALAASLFGAGASYAQDSSARAAVNGHVLSSSEGVSSYYGPGFHGRATATGEIFDRNGISAAHKSLPIPCFARVTNLANHRSIVVRVNDRGPFIAGRILDVSERVSKLLGYYPGMSRVRLDYLGKAGPASVDDSRTLLASLRNGDASTAIASANAKPAEDGSSSVPRTPALGYAEPARRAPAAAALVAAVRPTLAPLSLATQLDVSARQLEAAMEAARVSTERSARSGSPFGDLVVAPFKRMVEALK